MLTEIQIITLTVWAIVMVSCFIAELTATNFITLWFALGAAVAIIMAGFNVAWYYQIVAFVLVSLLTLAAFYPLIWRRIIKKKRPLTNIDNFIGKTIKIAKVNKPEDSLEISGYALIKDSFWSVKMLSSQPLHVHDLVVVKSVEGNILKADFKKELDKLVSEEELPTNNKEK